MFATKSYELAGFSAVEADELCFVNGGSTVTYNPIVNKADNAKKVAAIVIGTVITLDQPTDVRDRTVYGLYKNFGGIH